MKLPVTTQVKGTVLLAALMLFTLVLAFGAAAEGTDLTLFDTADGKWRTDYTQNIAAVGGTLYIARMDGLYAWNMGEEPRQVMDFSKISLDGAAADGQADAFMPISYLMSADGALYALDGKMEGLWRFDEGANAFTREAVFDADEVLFEKEEGGYIYSDFLLDRGDVYYTAVNTMSGNSSLVRLSTNSGKAEVVKNGICLATAFTAGNLLVAEGIMGWPESLSVLELDTGRLSKKLDISGDVKNVYYEAGTDTLYMVRKGAIYASVSFGEPKVAARIPVITPLSDGAQLSGGYVALAYEDGIRICKCDPEAVVDAPLSFVGQTYDLPIEDYSKQHPGAAFAFGDFFPMNTMELVAHMMSGEGSADIYVLNAGDYNLDALFEKGYYAGLEGSAAVRDTVDAMYPFIRDQVKRDGKIIALPFFSYYTLNTYNPKAFEEVGLQAADVPTTYEELLDFITLWGAEYREEFSTMSLFGQMVDTKLYRRLIAQQILEDRKYDCIRLGQPVTYDTPEMRALLNKLVATDFETLNALAPDASYNEYADLDHPPRQLLAVMQTASTQKAYTDFFCYMPLRLNKNKEPIIVCNPQVLIVNPYSRNFEAALAFAEYVAGNLSNMQRTDMMPGENEPMRNPYYDVATITQTISKLEEIIKTAKEEEKRSYQDQLDMWQQQLKENQRFEWLSTAESIAAFRGLDPYFMFKRSNPMTGMSSKKEVSDLFNNRFLQGQITVEQFLKEMDQKLRMIERED